MLKKFSLFVTLLYTITLTTFSLVKINTVVKSMPSFNDKAMHAFAHFVFVILWFSVFYYKYNIKYLKSLTYAALFSFIYGVLIEALQGLITVSRQSDFKDVFANVLGMIIAAIVIISVKKHVLKSNNTLFF